MFLHHTYTIKAGEKFNPEHCPMVTVELSTLREGMIGLPQANKDDIVISYLKNHSIDTAWISKNPTVVSTIISGALATSNIEAFFEGCKSNANFIHDFEHFIREQFQK